MKIEELDEAEGLTADMVRGYMVAKGWTFRNLMMDGSEDAIAPTGEPGFSRAVVPCRWESFAWIAGRVIDFERRSPQSIMREMNPRMKAGIPTDQEIEAHRSKSGAGWPWPWLAHDEHGNPRVGFWSRPSWQQTGPYSFYVQGRGYLTQDRVKAWSFWPADRNLARVPWRKVQP